MASELGRPHPPTLRVGFPPRRRGGVRERAAAMCLMELAPPGRLRLNLSSPPNLIRGSLLFCWIAGSSPAMPAHERDDGGEIQDQTETGEGRRDPPPQCRENPQS